MKKEFGVFLILGLLVLSLSFSSAGWLSDVYGKITGNSITGNAVLANSQCESGKLSLVNTAIRGTEYAKYNTSIKTNNISVVVCNSSTTAITAGNAIVACPSGSSSSFCVRSNTSSSSQVCSSYGLLGNCRSYTTQYSYKIAVYGVKVVNTSEPPVETTCTSFTYSDWSACSNGQQTRTIISQSPAGCTGGSSEALSQLCAITPTTCTDSDGGVNYYQQGNISFNGRLSVIESCYSGLSGPESIPGVTMVEYYCGDDSAAHPQVYQCPNGCSNGACVNSTVPPVQNVTCTDSDGGLNYYVKGSVVVGSCSSPNTCGGGSVSDFCPTSTIVWESACNATNNQKYSMNYSCPNGCVDGACYYPGYFISFDKENYSSGEFIKFNLIVADNSGSRVDVYLLVPNSEKKYPMITNLFVNKTYTNDFNISAYPNIFNQSGDYVLLVCDAGSSCDGNFGGTNSAPFYFSFSSISVCQAEVNMIKNPLNLTLDNVKWVLKSNNSYIDESSNEVYSYAYWNMQSNNQYNYVWASVAEMKDSSAVQQRLNDALENGICQVSRVSSDYTSDEYQNIYVCKNIWKIAYENQQVSQGSAWNYQNDVVAIWFNDNLLFNMEFSLNDYYTCRTSEDCDKMDNYQHQKEQNDLIEVIDQLIDNNAKYTSAGYLDYRSEQFVNHFLDGCDSEVKDLGYEGSWSCKIEPVLCPSHGEQKQICTRWNGVTEKDEVRETTLTCSPGICSGCYVPRWFGSNSENKCIQYGFRFEQEQLSKQSETITEREGSGNPGSEYLKILSETEADLIWYGKYENRSYKLIEGKSVEMRIPDVYTDFKIVWFIDNIVPSQNDETGYVSFTSSIPVAFNAYCDIDGQVKQQKVSVGGEWAKCQNNYECFSNACSNGECVDTAALAREITGFKGFIIKMLCRLSNPFSEDGYAQCLVENQ